METEMTYINFHKIYVSKKCHALHFNYWTFGISQITVTVLKPIFKDIPHIERKVVFPAFVVNVLMGFIAM